MLTTEGGGPWDVLTTEGLPQAQYKQCTHLVRSAGAGVCKINAGLNYCMY